MRIDPEDRIGSQRSHGLARSKAVGMGRCIAYLLLFTLLTLFSFGIAWLAATDSQRRQATVFVRQHIAGSDYILAALPIKIDSAISMPVETSKPVASKSRLVEKPHLNVCGKVRSEAIDHSMVVYQWLDENGGINVSDRPPTANSGYSQLSFKHIHVDNYFNLKIDNRYATMPAYTQDAISTGVTQIYKILSSVVKVAELRKIDLNIRFYSDPARFHAYRRTVAPETSSKAIGFYTSRLNQSTVLVQGDKVHVVSTAIHEASHAIVAAMFGGTPTWLNEGMAEFFEMYKSGGGQQRVFEMNSGHLRLLKQSQLPPLLSHFSQPAHQWYSHSNMDLNYAVGWSLVYFLMSSMEGRKFLRYMLDNLAVNYCKNFSTIAYFNGNYPGGLSGFERSWKKWLRRVRSGVLRL